MSKSTQSDNNLEKFERLQKAMEQHFSLFVRKTSEMLQEEHKSAQHEAKLKSSLEEVVMEQRQQLEHYKKRLADTEAELESKKKECDRLAAFLQDEDAALLACVEDTASGQPPAKRLCSRDDGSAQHPDGPAVEPQPGADSAKASETD